MEEVSVLNVLGVLVVVTWAGTWLIAVAKNTAVSSFLAMWLSIALGLWAIFDPEVILK